MVEFISRLLSRKRIMNSLFVAASRCVTHAACHYKRDATKRAHPPIYIPPIALITHSVNPFLKLPRKSECFSLISPFGMHSFIREIRGSSLEKVCFSTRGFHMN